MEVKKGQVIEVEAKEIRIGKRYRKSLTNLEELKDSIRQHGQLQPIGVYVENDKYHLIYGHRRTMACKDLDIPVKAIILDKPQEELSGQVLEFIENSVREDFSPVEKAAAVKHLHSKLMEEHENWSVEKTGKLLGLSRKYIHELLRVGAAVDLGQLNKEEVKDLSMKQLRSMTSLKGRIDEISKSVYKAVTENVEQKIKFLNGNCFDLVEKGEIKENSFNLMITDPPYGIEVSVSSASGKNDKKIKESRFDDGLDKMSSGFAEEFWRMADKVMDKEQAVVVSFCSVEQFFTFKHWAIACNFKNVYPKPLIWIKASAGQPFNALIQPSSCYEIMIFASRHNKVNIYTPGFPDWISIPRVKSEDRIHQTQKPVPLFEELIRFIAFPHYSFIDPFAGSGSSLIAAKKYGLKNIVGVELNEMTYKKAFNRVQKEG